jgi:hypothetical protein
MQSPLVLVSFSLASFRGSRGEGGRSPLLPADPESFPPSPSYGQLWESLDGGKKLGGVARPEMALIPKLASDNFSLVGDYSATNTNMLVRMKFPIILGAPPHSIPLPRVGGEGRVRGTALQGPLFPRPVPEKA